MPNSRPQPLILGVLLTLAAASAAATITDHREFEASLYAPWRADAGQGEARTFRLRFAFPEAAAPQQVAWVLELVTRTGAVARRWEGSTGLTGIAAEELVRWDGKLASGAPARGTYTVRLRAMLASGASDEQSWQIATAPPLTTGFAEGPPRPGRPAPRAAAQDYTVYYGNLHSQTNHSDGGADVRNCNGAQDPQTADFGPGDAWTYARARGLDFLMASEHNHMFDGSDGTNAAADPELARALYRSGLTAANDFNVGHPGFLALYGMEWGVINNGGHLNILNARELLGWEHNAGGQLLADLFTARSDYGALYTLMRKNGWIGQFNHPALTGQFAVGGKPYAYSPDGDTVMALCEVLNTSAFSTNTTETETSRRSFEDSCGKALEAGYHVAFSSDQDNHCANWGASFTNRTGVLVPAGQALTMDTFMDAVQARRVFATMDKGSKIVLTANGHIMGERFSNKGPLRLTVAFSNASGRTAAAVALMEGVPGRNGKVTRLAADADLVVTPTPGEHFYYAKITQDDGNVLWSAPVWITQHAAPLRPRRKP